MVVITNPLPDGFPTHTAVLGHILACHCYQHRAPSAQSSGAFPNPPQFQRDPPAST